MNDSKKSILDVPFFHCDDCGNEFSSFNDVGCVCPTPWGVLSLIHKTLKEKPPVCPNCGSSNVRHINRLKHILGDLMIIH